MHNIEKRHLVTKKWNYFSDDPFFLIVNNGIIVKTVL